MDALTQDNSAHKPHHIAAMIVQLYTALSAKSISDPAIIFLLWSLFNLSYSDNSDQYLPQIYNHVSYMEIYLKLTYSKAVADLEGFLWFWPKPPLRFQEASRNLVEYTLKLKYLEDSATPLL